MLVIGLEQLGLRQHPPEVGQLMREVAPGRRIGNIGPEQVAEPVARQRGSLGRQAVEQGPRLAAWNGKWLSGPRHLWHTEQHDMQCCGRWLGRLVTGKEVRHDLQPLAVRQGQRRSWQERRRRSSPIVGALPGIVEPQDLRLARESLTA